MYILAYERISQDIIEACGSSAIANLLSITKTIVNLIQIIGPILALVALTACFIKLMTNPEEKKYKAGLKNSIIALVVLFLIPFLINLTMSLTDESFDLAKCWNNAEKVATLKGESQYVETSDKEHQQFIPNEDDYDEAEVTADDDEKETDNPGNSNSEITKTIFIGDSRTVQMYAYLTNDWSGANYSSGGVHIVENDIFIAEGSQGLNWMKSTGIPAANPYFQSGTAMVILMGVNDLGNASSYITYINSNISSWINSGIKVYYSAVTPCTGSYSYLNSQIESFNAKIKQEINSNVGWIDSYNYLTNNGYNTTDGLHYDKTTSDKIYNYIKQNI